MRRVYNRAGRALIPEPRSPEKRIKRLVRENGRTTKFVIAFESVDAPLRNDSVLTLSVCNRVKCRSCLRAGSGGGRPCRSSVTPVSAWWGLRFVPPGARLCLGAGYPDGWRRLSLLRIGGR